jgi:Inner membrane protein YgaP-like, transmembrane domain
VVWNIRLVLFFDGVLVLVSLVLFELLHPYWPWFTALLAGMMIQAASTGLCPIAKTLKALAVKSSPAFK